MVTGKSLERSDRMNELKEHSMEPREFEGADWEGTRQDSELLWNLREALSRSIEKGELEARILSEAVMESELHEAYEPPASDGDLLLAELDATPLETNVDQKEQKVENAESAL